MRKAGVKTNPRAEGTQAPHPHPGVEAWTCVDVTHWMAGELLWGLTEKHLELCA